MRHTSLFAWTVLALAATSDLLVFAMLHSVNARRLTAQTPPLLELGYSQVFCLFALQIVVFMGAWWTVRRIGGGGHRLARGTSIALFLLLIVRAGVILSAYSGPVDRARTARTAARVRGAETRVTDFWGRTHRLPANLEEAGVDSEERIDGWGFSLRYEVDPDDHGFSVTAIGVPKGLKTRPTEMMQINRRMADAP